MSRISNNHERGFTLVEVAVVVPMIIIIVIGILAMLILLVSNNVIQGSRSNLVNNTRAALANIEKDVDNSSTFLPSVLSHTNFKDNNEPGLSKTYKAYGTLKNNPTPSNNLNTLFIQSYNQIVDPNDSSNTKIIPAFKGTPPCSGSATAQTTNIVPIAILYFINDGTLYRRTIIDQTNPTACGTLLVKQACPAGISGGTPACVVQDTALLTNVSRFTVAYYLNASDPTAMAAYDPTPSPTIDQAKAIFVTITSSTSANGTDISHSSFLRMTRSGT